MRKGISLCLPFDQTKYNELINKRGYVICQTKVDGVHAVWKEGKLVSSEGNEFKCLPTLTEQLKLFMAKESLEGELYVHGWSRQKIMSVTRRTKNVHPDENKIQFWIFDWLTDKQLPYTARLHNVCLLLQEMIEQGMPYSASLLRYMPSWRVTKDRKLQYIEDCQYAISEGYEGIVVKDPLAPWTEGKGWHAMKWKPLRSDTVTIIEVIEGTGKYENTLGSLLVRDQDGREYKIGSFNINDQERAELWQKRLILPGKKCKIRYFDASEDSIPTAGVFTCLVED